MFVVFGATGNTGSAVARTLLERNARVRVVVRDLAKGAVWRDRGADVRRGDLADARSLAALLRGAAGAYVLNPPAYRDPDLFHAAERLADAIHAAVLATRPPRLVVLSSVGAHLKGEHGNVRTNSIFEERLADLPVRVTFLRPAYFMENWGWAVGSAANVGVLPSFLAPLDRAVPMVSTEDVGRVAAETLLDPHAPPVVELSGPRPYSPRDAAVALGRCLQRSVTPVEVPESDWPRVLTGEGFAPTTIHAWVELFRGFNSGHIAFESEFGRTRGRVTLDEAVARLVASAEIAVPAAGEHP